MATGRRLFFALWPDAALREAIALAARTAARAAGITGKRVHDEKLHLTLAFLGELDAAAEAEAAQAAATVRAPAFDLALDQVGSFFRSKVLWVGAHQAPAPLVELSQTLRTALDSAGVAFDRKALAPHVTCYRDIRSTLKPVAIDPLSWAVREFALVHSAGGQYHVVSQWRLQYVPMYRVKTVQNQGGPE
jgi:2'-5' RNA ligase